MRKQGVEEEEEEDARCLHWRIWLEDSSIVCTVYEIFPM
jgi:hypothetical protein